MTKVKCAEMASQLLATYGNRGFEISMPDQQSYDLMRATMAGLNRKTEPDGEFFVVKVLGIVG